MTDVTGSTLADALRDRYRLDRELGQGGMATVFLAHDLHNNRPVALKVLRPELAAILGAERFLKEIETTANLQHPHILPLFDSGQAGTLLFYVMPYVEGESLRARLSREKQLPITDTVRIASEVASALDYAHRHGVLHRDIKPENILLHDGQALVADFGIALAMRKAGGARLTETGLSLGTPQYMSPEQATAERELDARTDIYALGAVTYEMLTGEAPFTGTTTQAIIAKLMTEVPRPPSVLRKAVPEAIERAVLTALEKLPADRFASAAQFAEALTSLSATPAPRTSARPVARTPSRWRTVALGATSMAVAAGLLAAWGWLRPPSRPVSRYRLALPTAQAFQQGALGVNLAISPDGASMVYLGPGEGGGQLWVRERDRLDATPLRGTTGASNPFFSPDGRQIGFFEGIRYQLKMIPRVGGPPVTLLEVTGGGGGAWSPDGWVYFDTPRGLSRMREGGGEPEPIVSLDTLHGELGHAWPEVLPNGKGLLFRSRHNSTPEDFDIVVLDLTTRQRRDLVKGLVARYVAPGYLMIVRADGALYVAPFDPDRLQLTGPPVPIIEGLMTKAFGSADLVISREGTLVYVPGRTGVAGPPGEVVWVDREGSVTPFNPPLVLSPPFNAGLALSPDGTRLAINAVGPTGDDIWVKQLPSGTFVRLTFEGNSNIRPQWTADGKSILYTSERSGGTALWMQRADGGASAEQVGRGVEPIREAIVSRDGNWFVYRTFGTNGRDIYASRAGADTAPIPLLTTKFNELAPALSPDGRWLAYSSDESGGNEVYVRPFPRVGDGRWQISTGGGSAPAWAHSGRELFYQSGTNEMMAVGVTLSPSFTAGTPHKLFDAIPELYPTSFVGRYYDLTPDDQRFVMVRMTRLGGSLQAPGEGQLVIVENFREEIRRKLSAARQ